MVWFSDAEQDCDSGMYCFFYIPRDDDISDGGSGGGGNEIGTWGEQGLLVGGSQREKDFTACAAASQSKRRN